MCVHVYVCERLYSCACMCMCQGQNSCFLYVSALEYNVCELEYRCCGVVAHMLFATTLPRIHMSLLHGAKCALLGHSRNVTIGGEFIYIYIYTPTTPGSLPMMGGGGRGMGWGGLFGLPGVLRCYNMRTKTKQIYIQIPEPTRNTFPQKARASGLARPPGLQHSPTQRHGVSELERHEHTPHITKG